MLLKIRAVGTVLRGAAAAAMVSALVISNTGCGDDDDNDVLSGTSVGTSEPKITVIANVPEATETGTFGQFTISLSEPASSNLELHYTFEGTARSEGSDSDFDADPGTSVTILAGNDTATVTIKPISDGFGEGNETVSLVLYMPAAGYAAGESTTAELKIIEDFELVDLGMRLNIVTPGSFLRGSSKLEEYRDTDEGPRVATTLSKAFWIADSEITIDQFRAFLLDASRSIALAPESGQSPETTGTIAYAAPILEPTEGVDFVSGDRPLENDGDFSIRNDTFGTAGNGPMVEISYAAATNFCIWLTARESQNGAIPTGYEYRLPTEQEWEYSCRAWTYTAFSCGDGVTVDEGKTYDILDEYAWYKGNVGKDFGNGGAQFVRQKLPNNWGLYDMHGNVWEWCYDWYDVYNAEADKPNVDEIPDTEEDNVFLGNPLRDSFGPTSGAARVMRGGSWLDEGKDCRSADRGAVNPSTTAAHIGFRVVLGPIVPTD